MRETEFRGKRFDNVEWVYGDLLHGRYGIAWIVVDAKTTLYEPGSADAYPSPKDAQNLYRIDPGTLGEYTGLKDKAGKEVYEDDLVKDSLGRIGHVLFENGSYHLRNIHGTFLLSSFASEGEVIGNRHDTPELLERSSDARQIPN